MFFIVNKTKSIITISDLKLSLGPHQAIDLDRIISRNKTENSKFLKKAVARGKISIKRKDEVNNSTKIEMNFDGIDKNDMNDIRKEIKKELKEGIKEISDEIKGQNTKDNNAVSKEDLKEIMTQMMNMMQQNQVQSQNITKENEEEVQIDDNTLSDIHSRAVKKITKNSEMKSINYKEEKIKDDINKNIDELENLLG